jgi:hypothetical protein
MAGNFTSDTTYKYKDSLGVNRETINKDHHFLHK